MAIVDKIKQRFDENYKADKQGVLNALIYASHNLDAYKPIVPNIPELKVNEKLILRLIPTLELFRREGRLTAFGDTYEVALNRLLGEITQEELAECKDRLESLMTPGGEMGIWVDATRKLNPLAQQVAKNEITVRRYLSVVFLNLFSFFTNKEGTEIQYKHFLYEILNYIEENGTDKEIGKEDLQQIFGFYEENSDTKLGNQVRIIIDYLTSTEFFDLHDKAFKITPYWAKNIKHLKSFCNLEYKDATLEEVATKLNRRTQAKAYSEYVIQNSHLLTEKVMNVLKTVVSTGNEPIINEAADAVLVEGKVGINRLFFGAPGTGKSFNIKNFIREHGIKDYSDKEDHPNVYRTTLHPEFSYSDFVGQVMPVVEGGNISYKFEPKIFTEALTQAFKKENFGKRPVFLILEEMSRANVAAVFGDLFQLLDRDENGESEYRINNSLIAMELSKNAYDVFGEPTNRIYIPSNLFIIGTVNTSDQNVYVMDTAFKRRFEFKYIPTKIQPELEHINDYKFEFNKPNISFTWIQLLNALNSYIVGPIEKGGLGLKEDKQLGHFFIKFKKASSSELEHLKQIEEYNKNQISGKLIQYLWNDVEKASYSDNKIFNRDILHFGELYERTIEGSNIFSTQFIECLKSLGASTEVEE